MNSSYAHDLVIASTTYAITATRGKLVVRIYALFFVTCGCRSVGFRESRSDPRAEMHYVAGYAFEGLLTQLAYASNIHITSSARLAQVTPTFRL